MRAVAILALVALTACGQSDDAILFDGQAFRARAATVGEDSANFAVSVSPVSASLFGAREAARYEATKYCIANWGSSRISWVVGPDADPRRLALQAQGDTLTLAGRCTP